MPWLSIIPWKSTLGQPGCLNVSGVSDLRVIHVKSLATMHPFNMLLHVALLVEALPASWQRTNIRFFSAVDSNVSIEFCEATEDFVACLSVRRVEIKWHVGESSVFNEALHCMVAFLIGNIVHRLIDFVILFFLWMVYRFTHTLEKTMNPMTAVFLEKINYKVIAFGNIVLREVNGS